MIYRNERCRVTGAGEFRWGRGKDSRGYIDWLFCIAKKMSPSCGPVNSQRLNSRTNPATNAGVWAATNPPGPRILTALFYFERRRRRRVTGTWWLRGGMFCVRCESEDEEKTGVQITGERRSEGGEEGIGTYSCCCTEAKLMLPTIESGGIVHRDRRRNETFFP